MGKPNAIKDKSFAKDLLTLWLADKVLKTIENEEYKKQALELAIKTLK